jgi:hypothetical protein
MSKKLTAKQPRFKTYLAAQTKETLVAMLLDVAQRDEELAQSLLVKSTPPGKQDSLVSEMRQVIDGVTFVDGFIDWRSTHSFSDPLSRAVDTLAMLLTPERAGVLVELAQYAIERTEGVLDLACPRQPNPAGTAPGPRHHNAGRSVEPWRQGRAVLGRHQAGSGI